MKREVRRSFSSFRPQVAHLEDRLQPGSLITGGASSLLFDSFLDRLSAQAPADLSVASQTSTYEQSDLVQTASQAPAFRLLPSSQETQQGGTVAQSETSGTPAFATVAQQASQLLTVASSVQTVDSASQPLETVVNQGGGTITESGKNYVLQLANESVTAEAVEAAVNHDNIPQLQVSAPIAVDWVTCAGTAQEDDLYVSFSPHDPIPATERDTASVAISGSDGAQYFAGSNTRTDGSFFIDPYVTQRSDAGCATILVDITAFDGTHLGFEMQDGAEGDPGVFWFVGDVYRDTGEINAGFLQLDINAGLATIATFAGPGSLSGVNIGPTGVNLTGTVDPDFTGSSIVLAGTLDPFTFDFVGVTVTFASPAQGRAIDNDSAGNLWVGGQIFADFIDELPMFMKLAADFSTVEAFVYGGAIGGGVGDPTVGPGYGLNAVFVDSLDQVYLAGAMTGVDIPAGPGPYTQLISKIDAASITQAYGWRWFIAGGNLWANDNVVDDGGFMIVADTNSGALRPSGLYDLDARILVFTPTGDGIVDDIGYANPDEDTEPREEALSIAQASTAELANLYIAGITNAENFEPIINPCQATYQGGQDGFFAGLSQPF